MAEQISRVTHTTATADKLDLTGVHELHSSVNGRPGIHVPNRALTVPVSLPKIDTQHNCDADARDQ